MAYAEKNFKTKKAFAAAVAAGPVRLTSPIFQPARHGVEFVEGPWGDHRWYAQVEMKDGIVVKVK